MSTREPTVRIATWNLLHAPPKTFEPRIIEAAAHIRALRPDVLLVQEAVCNTHRYDAL
jgi:hypothetical protein